MGDKKKRRRKKFTIVIAAMVNVLGSLAVNIYYPALVPLSESLQVSKSDINLTIMSYMIFQALLPLFTGNISDQRGRRPVLLVCMFIFIATNIGLALQTNFAALMVLRCFQSFGSSGSIVVSSSIILDLITRAERGKYMVYSSLGTTIGPAVGPIAGGLLTHFLGWRSLFWFLAIFAGVMVLVILICLQETCRTVVGNGSLPPQPWNRSILQVIRPPHVDHTNDTRVRLPNRPRIVDSLKLLLDKQTAPLLLTYCVIYCGGIAVLSTLPALLVGKYAYNSLQVGLCYIPMAVGSIAARWTVGTVADWNFRRHSLRVGIDVQRNRQTKEQLRQTPLEKIRLQIAIPLLYLSCLFVLGYSWILNYNLHVSGPLVMLFFVGNTSAGAGNMVSALIMDFNAYRPAMAMAAITVSTFLPGAGVAAAALPLVEKVGIGWVGTLVAGCWFISSPVLWLVYLYGYGWRQQRQSAE
ncbi:MFS general substrate transporter [Aspergillus minisclerotigenes]|uniref:Citrate exporter 1 n=1 Tax=Aspergillus minisclerotigenes TaxID=656917 RepID=A0A5N6J0K8_9EURO|nr:MFS general substrate transporter [Aspergillus minisclerotigenes]